MVKTICQTCGNEFNVRSYQLKIGTGKYCSSKCRGKGVNKPVPVEERIMKFIDVKEENDCWEFKGSKNKDGYGKIGIGGKKNESAHRVIFKIYNFDIPKNMVILHTCDNPSCCNPKHLVLGTQNDNIQDMVQKRRNKIRKGSIMPLELLDEIKNNYKGQKGFKIEMARKYNCSPTKITNLIEKYIVF